MGYYWPVLTALNNPKRKEQMMKITIEQYLQLDSAPLQSARVFLIKERKEIKAIRQIDKPARLRRYKVERRTNLNSDGCLLIQQGHGYGTLYRFTEKNDGTAILSVAADKYGKVEVNDSAFDKGLTRTVFLKK